MFFYFCDVQRYTWTVVELFELFSDTFNLWSYLDFMAFVLFLASHVFFAEIS